MAAPQTDLWTFQLNKDFTQDEVINYRKQSEWAQYRMIPLRRGTVGIVDKNLAKDERGAWRKIIKVDIYVLTSHGWQHWRKTFLPRDVVTPVAKFGTITVSDPSKNWALITGVDQSDGTSSDLTAFFQLFLKIMTSKTLGGGKSNYDQLIDTGVTPAIAELCNTKASDIAQIIEEGMMFADSWDLFRSRMPTAQEIWSAQHMPPYNELQDKRKRDEALKRHFFYIIIYRGTVSIGLYTGRSKDWVLRRTQHRDKIDSASSVMVSQHYRIARDIMGPNKAWKMIPICAINPEALGRHAPMAVNVIEQLLIAFFETYNGLLLDEQYMRVSSNSHLPPSVTVSHSAPLARLLSKLASQLKALPRFRAFKHTGEVKGCNWSSPLLEGAYVQRFWARTTLFDDNGRPHIYQFRGPVRLVQIDKTKGILSALVIQDYRGEKKLPKKFFVTLPPGHGLEVGTQVHMVVEIMVDGKKRHPTPWLAGLPTVGPYDCHSQLFRCALKVEWRDKTSGQWMSRALAPDKLLGNTLGQAINASNAKPGNTTLPDVGEAAGRVQSVSVQILRLMTTLMKWEWATPNPPAPGANYAWLAYLEAWKGVFVQSQEYDFLNQRIEVKKIPTQQVDAPRFYTMDETAARIYAEWGNKVDIGFLPPGREKIGDPTRPLGQKPRTRCDMCWTTQTNQCDQREVSTRGNQKLYSCHACELLNRYCTFAHSTRERVSIDFPGLAYTSRPRVQYPAVQIAHAPVNVDLTNLEPSELEEITAEDSGAAGEAY